ncbi:MAG TPA: hypothetical protein PLS28_03825 [Clostridiales bacterium]|jgi:hypothetical protein|nr:hypothetical protein [Clostridiales bacterium]
MKTKVAGLFFCTVMLLSLCGGALASFAAGTGIASTGDHTYYIIGGIAAAAIIVLIVFSILGKKK